VGLSLTALLGVEVPVTLTTLEQEAFLVALLAPDQSQTWPDYRAISVAHRRGLAARLAARDARGHAWVTAEAELWRATARLAAAFPFLGLSDARYLAGAVFRH
jgi:hypothetical protein